MKDRLLALGLLLLVGPGCADGPWTSLEDMSELTEVFNRDRGNVRIVLLLSPT